MRERGNVYATIVLLIVKMEATEESNFPGWVTTGFSDLLA
jgi:hypothetical protein